MPSSSSSPPSRANQDPNKSNSKMSPLQRLLVRSQFLHGSIDDDEKEGDRKLASQEERVGAGILSDRPRAAAATTAAAAASWTAWWTPPSRRILHPSHRSESASPRRRSSAAAVSPTKSLEQQHYHHAQRRSPNLTAFLFRLNEHLETFCRLLADPSVPHAVQAASLLDAGVATATTGSSSGSRNSSPRPSPLASRGGYSPPLATLFSKKTTTPTTSAAAMAMEVEWETYVSPLLMLAGAEALYGQLEHLTTTPLQDSSSSHNSNTTTTRHHRHHHSSDLSVLYKTIHKDLGKVQAELCEKFLQDSPLFSTEMAESRRNKVKEAARAVHVALEGLKCLANARCFLVEWQVKLFSLARRRDLPQQKETTTQKDEEDESINLNSMMSSCREWIPEMVDTAAASHSLMGLSSELRTWMALVETMAQLEQCRFMETILAAKKMKTNMNLESSAILQRWFRHALERLLCIMPIYFDRVTTFASPLYGFDHTHFAQHKPEGDRLGIVEDYETSILDFLRRQESKGGPATAVSILVDAVPTKNLHLEQGVILLDQVENEEILEGAERERQEWQAVYMRSTLHSSISQNSMSRSPSSAASSGLFRLSAASFRPSQNFLGTAHSSKRDMDTECFRVSPGHARKVFRSVDSSSTSTSQMHVMEYAPTRGPCSWPHTEWSSLVQIITGHPEMEASRPDGDGDVTRTATSWGRTLTYRRSSTASTDGSALKTSPRGQNHASPTEAGSYFMSSATWMGTWGSALPAPPLTSPPPPPPPASSKTPKPASSSAFHVARLSKFLWMVVIVKGEEEAKWQLLRSRGHSDEEIREFLDDLASKLCVSSSVLRPDSVSMVQLKHKTKGVPGHDLSQIWKDSKSSDEAYYAQEFLLSLRESFGLRQSPLIQKPYNGLFRGVKRSVKSPRRGPLLRKRRVYNHEESAIAFFLGEELIKSVQR